MKKIKTLFKKNPKNLGRVINEVDPQNEWVYKTGVATRKYDGSSVAIINGELYKRFDLKKGRVLPPNAIPCQDADTITGHHPHWIKCDRNENSNKYHFLAFDKLDNKEDGTYELCGTKVNGNREKIQGHVLIKHGEDLLFLDNFEFETIKSYLENNDIEGIVFHDSISSNMCKIRKSDFGIKRTK